MKPPMKGHLPARLALGLGPLAAISIVAGNVIGSGIYVIPATLAEIAGPVAIIAWVVNAGAFLCLAAVFAELGSAYPSTGGPQAFVNRAFGKFWGLQVAFLYWLSCIASNAAMATGFVGYLTVFLPVFSKPLYAFVVAQCLIWILTAANILGVREGGFIHSVTTVLKLLPLVLLCVPLLMCFSPDNWVPFAPHGFGAALPSLSLIAWLFLGIESGTVPGEEVKGGGRTIWRAAYSGYGLATAVYLLLAIALIGGMPQAAIAGSTSPLAVAAMRFYGPAGSWLVAIGALISIAGALNGWLLVTGRLPYGAARDGYCPAWIGRINPRFRTPAISLAISSLVSSLLIVLYFNKTLLQAYNFIALLSTASALVAIGVACAAYLALRKREPSNFSGRHQSLVQCAAFISILVVLLMIAGSGWQIIYLTLLSMILPALYYLRLRKK